MIQLVMNTDISPSPVYVIFSPKKVSDDIRVKERVNLLPATDENLTTVLIHCEPVGLQEILPRGC